MHNNSLLKIPCQGSFYKPTSDEKSRKLKNSMRQMEMSRFQTKPLNRSIEYFMILQRLIRYPHTILRPG
jgi:hypothetical protein